MVLDFGREAIEKMNDEQKSATITKEDIEQERLQDSSAQELINEVDLMGDLI